MNGSVGCEGDPEKTNWDEDTTDLPHNEPEFGPDGAMPLELLTRKAMQTDQLGGEWETIA